MSTARQQSRRRAICRGAAITIIAMTAYCYALGLADAITR